MSLFQKISLLLVRVSLGWLFFYAGLSKILTPGWSAAGYINGAQSGTWLYSLFLNSSILPVVNALVQYGLLLLGVALILGVFVRLSALLGSLLMILLYFPILTFPYAGKTAFIIDDHIIFIATLALLAAFRAGRVWGLAGWCSRLPICSRFPKLRSLLD